MWFTGSILGFNYCVEEPLDLLFRRYNQFISPVKVLPGFGTAHQEHAHRVGTKIIYSILKQEDISF